MGYVTPRKNTEDTSVENQAIQREWPALRYKLKLAMQSCTSHREGESPRAHPCPRGGSRSNSPVIDLFPMAQSRVSALMATITSRTLTYHLSPHREGVVKGSVPHNRIFLFRT